MAECSLTQSSDARNWPEGIISAKMTMNPYILAMAIEEAYKSGLPPWEYINTALWEKLGKPDHDTLMQFAANLEIVEEDPKWKKRLKITARHEVAVDAYRKELKEVVEQADAAGGNGVNRRQQ